jgi:hypothetical protein
MCIASRCSFFFMGAAAGDLLWHLSQLFDKFFA